MSDSLTDEEKINANVVIDNGSWMIKAGFAGDALPRAIFPSVVGRPKCSSDLLHIPDINEPRVGHEAIKKRGILRLKYPIECRRITDFDDMERVSLSLVFLMKTFLALSCAISHFKRV